MIVFIARVITNIYTVWEGNLPPPPYMRRSKFSESEKDKIMELRGNKIDWKTLQTMFGASKDTIKSMIRRESQNRP